MEVQTLSIFFSIMRALLSCELIINYNFWSIISTIVTYIFSDFVLNWWTYLRKIEKKIKPHKVCHSLRAPVVTSQPT
jgi:hypothetical protein